VTFKIIAFYKFVHLDELPALRISLKELCASNDLFGSILLAVEGINVMVGGAPAAIDTFIDRLKKDDRFSDIEAKVSFATEQPFRKMKVRIKKEIITFGAPDIHTASRGVYVKPQGLSRGLM
jgi:UPF0176 protein